MHKDLENVISTIWNDRKNIFNCFAREFNLLNNIHYYYERPCANSAVRYIEYNYLRRLYDNDYSDSNYLTRKREGVQYDNFLVSIGELFKKIDMKALMIAWDDGDLRHSHETTPQILYDQIKGNKYNPAALDGSIKTIYDGLIHKNVSISASRTLNSTHGRIGQDRVDSELPLRIDYCIYLNMVLETNYSFMALEWMLRKLKSDPGWSAVLIEGPFNESDATVSLFFRSQSALMRGIQNISPTAHHFRASFRHFVPPMTIRVKELIGVSWASTKSPKLKVVKRNNGYYAKRDSSQTYSRMCAQLILQALERTYRPSEATKSDRFWNTCSFRSFKWRVERYFKRVGIVSGYPGNLYRVPTEREIAAIS